MTCHGEKASYDLSFFNALRQRREDAKGGSPGYAARLRLAPFRRALESVGWYCHFQNIRFYHVQIVSC